MNYKICKHIWSYYWVVCGSKCYTSRPGLSLSTLRIWGGAPEGGSLKLLQWWTLCKAVNLAKEWVELRNSPRIIGVRGTQDPGGHWTPFHHFVWCWDTKIHSRLLGNLPLRKQQAGALDLTGWAWVSLILFPHCTLFAFRWLTVSAILTHFCRVRLSEVTSYKIFKRLKELHSLPCYVTDHRDLASGLFSMVASKFGLNKLCKTMVRMSWVHSVTAKPVWFKLLGFSSFYIFVFKWAVKGPPFRKPYHLRMNLKLNYFSLKML